MDWMNRHLEGMAWDGVYIGIYVHGVGRSSPTTGMELANVYEDMTLLTSYFKIYGIIFTLTPSLDRWSLLICRYIVYFTNADYCHTLIYILFDP